MPRKEIPQEDDHPKIDLADDIATVRRILDPACSEWEEAPAFEALDRIEAAVKGPIEITDEIVKRASSRIENAFAYADFPGTRMPGTEFVDCVEVARLALRAALSGEIGILKRRLDGALAYARALEADRDDYREERDIFRAKYDENLRLSQMSDSHEGDSG